MTDRLTSMSVFVKAADLGSFTAAAAALGLSSQMVGKHVGLLETRLGAELLRRTTRRQSLTAIGQAYYERCRSILAETEAAEALAHDLSATPRGQLRVNAPVTFGAVCLAPVISGYLSRYTEVDIALTLDDRYVDLVDEGYDVVLRLGPLRNSTLLSRSLAPHRLIVCASQSYLRAHGAPVVPEDLVAHDCLGFIYTTGLPLTQWQFSRAGRSETVEVRSRFRSNDSRVLVAAALDGRGVIMQGERILRDDLAAGRLVQVLPDYRVPSREMHLLFSASRRQTPKLRTFVDCLVEAFGSG